MIEPAQLTSRQREIVLFIGRFKRDNGVAPTRKEIAAAFGFKSDNAAQCHLVLLAKKGFVRLHANRHRCIELLTLEGTA